jgi:hypothetical protein
MLKMSLPSSAFKGVVRSVESKRSFWSSFPGSAR